MPHPAPAEAESRDDPQPGDMMETEAAQMMLAPEITVRMVSMASELKEQVGRLAVAQPVSDKIERLGIMFSETGERLRVAEARA